MQMIPHEVGILERDRANQLSEMMKRNQNSSPGTKAQSQGKTFRNRKIQFPSSWITSASQHGIWTYWAWQKSKCTQSIAAASTAGLPRIDQDSCWSLATRRLDLVPRNRTRFLLRDLILRRLRQHGWSLFFWNCVNWPRVMFFAEACSQLCNWFTVCNQPSPAQQAMQLARCGSCSMHRPFWRIAVPGRKILLHLACTACSSRCADHRSASSAEVLKAPPSCLKRKLASASSVKFELWREDKHVCHCLLTQFVRQSWTQQLVLTVLTFWTRNS